MEGYARSGLRPAPMLLSEIDRLIVIGSDRMMRAVAQARHARAYRKTASRKNSPSSGSTAA
jgi:hypothetical protein